MEKIYIRRVTLFRKKKGKIKNFITGMVGGVKVFSQCKQDVISIQSLEFCVNKIRASTTGRIQCEVLTTLPFFGYWIKKFLGQQLQISDHNSVQQLFRLPSENLQHRWTNNLRKNLNKLHCGRGYCLPRSVLKFFLSCWTNDVEDFPKALTDVRGATGMRPQGAKLFHVHGVFFAKIEK